MFRLQLGSALANLAFYSYIIEGVISERKQYSTEHFSIRVSSAVSYSLHILSNLFLHFFAYTEHLFFYSGFACRYPSHILSYLIVLIYSLIIILRVPPLSSTTTDSLHIFCFYKLSCRSSTSSLNV
jgi:hypothetical protein